MNGIIIILGSPNDEQGNLSRTAIERLAEGTAEYRRCEGYKILCTGGFGEHFNTTDNPHAYYAVRHLIADGIPEGDILEIAQSRNTLEDALLSKPIVEKYGVRSLVVVSSDFHMERVMYIFERVFGGYDLTFLGAKASLPQELSQSLLDHEKREMERLRKKGIPGLS